MDGRWVAGFLGVLVWGALVGLGGGPAEGARWSRASINALPDEAFASVEVAPDGTVRRHLPHHDAEGRLDLPHLKSALGRWHQVKWLDPASAEAARRHLLDHYRQLGLSASGKGRGRSVSAPPAGVGSGGGLPAIVAGAAHPRKAARPAGPRGPSGMPRGRR